MTLICRPGTPSHPHGPINSAHGLEECIPSPETVEHAIEEKELTGIDYDDYIITHSTTLYTVFIWARCADGEDMFVIYPARSEFVGLENRGRYNLKEIQRILTEAYRDS